MNARIGILCPVSELDAILLVGVLINPEPVIERPSGGWDTACITLERGFCDALKIDALDGHQNPDLVPLGEEHPVIDEAMDLQQAV